MVSIILPTYERAHLIQRSVDSVINQTFENWELIICDDGSSDASREVIERCASSDSRICSNFNLKNIGLPKNRNIGLSLAKGELIFFIEDDLVLETDCLEVLVETYLSLERKYLVGAVAPRLKERWSFNYNKSRMDRKRLVAMFDPRTGEIYFNYDSDFGEVQEVVCVHACSLYSRELFWQIGGYPEKVYVGNYGRHETELVLRTRNLGYRFFFQPKAVAHHSNEPVGGCSVSSPFIKLYHFVRNHIVFVSRMFGIKATYMVPLFLLNTSYKTAYVLINGLQDQVY